MHHFVSNPPVLRDYKGKLFIFHRAVLTDMVYQLFKITAFKTRWTLTKKYFSCFYNGADTPRPLSSEGLWPGRSCKESHPLAFSKLGSQHRELQARRSSWLVEWDAGGVAGKWVDLFRSSTAPQSMSSPVRGKVKSSWHKPEWSDFSSYRASLASSAGSPYLGTSTKPKFVCPTQAATRSPLNAFKLPSLLEQQLHIPRG